VCERVAREKDGPGREAVVEFVAVVSAVDSLVEPLAPMLDVILDVYSR
jgi:hypothetical protein